MQARARATWVAAMLAVAVAVGLAVAMPVRAQCLGDANHDGFVNFQDFLEVQGRFGVNCANEPYCGNDAIDPGEGCDGGDLGGATCATEGFAGGNLACDLGCVLDTSGCYAVRYIDNANGTITDNQTGLMWEKKSDDGSIHDKDNTYTWGSDVAPYPPNGTAFTDHIARLNGSADGVCFAGRCDWRLPTLEELQGILEGILMQPCATPPCVAAAFNSNCSVGCTITSCSCTHSGHGLYWSATTVHDLPSYALRFSFRNNFMGFDTKTGNSYVRAVRGGS